MSRGPDKKEVDIDILESIVSELGPCGIEEVKREYNNRSDNSISWNTVKDRLKDNEQFVRESAGGFTFWNVEKSDSSLGDSLGKVLNGAYDLIDDHEKRITKLEKELGVESDE